MASNAHKNRAEVTESLRRFGMAEAGIEAVFASEAQIAENARAKRAANRKPVEATALDFGDWE